jgi:myo-inositol-1(or 4)-monophosphatase
MNSKQLAIKTAKEAGKELKKLFITRKVKATLKSKYEIVTTADKLAEKIILKDIRKHFPEHQILSEESGLTKNKSDYLWVVDPLDGTTNFFMHNPIFSVSIGLFYKGEAILGVIYVPMLDELYVAEKGKGAYMNNKKLKVSNETKPSNSYLTFCHGNKTNNINKAIQIYNKLKKQARDFRQLGSAAIELAYVARGITECILIPGALRWDVAAGILMVREAGGRVTDFKNEEWNVKSKDMLASNGKVHKALLRYVN